MSEHKPIPGRLPSDPDHPMDPRYSRREVPKEDFDRLIEAPQETE